MAKIITLGALIDKTVEHYRDHFKELVGITLWLIIGTSPFLFSAYIAPAGVDQATPAFETAAYLITNFIGLISATATSLWIAACLMLTIHARAQGTTFDHAVLGKTSWKFLPSLVVLSAGIAVALIAASIAVVLPGLLLTTFNTATGALGTFLGVLGVLLIFAGAGAALYILLRFSVECAFAQFTLVLDKLGTPFSFKNIWKAVQTSRALVKGAWWNVALRLFIPNAIISLIVIAANMAVTFSTSILVSFASASLSALAIKLIAVGITLSVFIVNALVMPLYSLATYYLYDSVNRT